MQKLRLVLKITVRVILALLLFVFIFDQFSTLIIPMLKTWEGCVAAGLVVVLFIIDAVLNHETEEEKEEDYENIDYLINKIATVDIPQGMGGSYGIYKIIEAWKEEDDEEGVIQATLELIPRQD